MKRISLLLLLSLSGCMGSFAQKKIETDIAVLRRDMDQLRADTKKTSGDVELRQRLADMGATMEQIRTDISLIQGRMESLQDAQSKRSDEALKVRQELEIRIAQLDEQMRALQKQLDAAKTSVAIATPAATPSPLGTLVVPDGAVRPTPLPTDPGKTIPLKLTDQQLYQKGIEARDGKRYTDARATFTELITKFPKSDFADNSRYWIGETYYDEKDFASAILEFDKVVKDYKNSDKVPAALLKQGYAFLEIGEKEGGVATLQDLVRKYPKSEEAKKAKEKLAKLK